MDYFTVLTNIGAQKIAAATAANSTINLTHIAVGDGSVMPSVAQTTLVNEVFRTALSELKVDEINKNHMIARSIIPADEGNFWVREVGIFDIDGDLIAVGNYPETYKSILAQGAAKEIDLNMVFEVANTEVVKLLINPSIVMASQEFVNEKLKTRPTNEEMNTAIDDAEVPYATVEEVVTGTVLDKVISPKILKDADIYAKKGGDVAQKFKVDSGDTSSEAVNKGQLDTAIANNKAFPSGTRLIFQQSSAPTGWIKEVLTAYNDVALKFTTGDVSTGGNVVFSNAFKSQTIRTSISGSVGATTLGTSQMPRHAHANGSVMSTTKYNIAYGPYDIIRYNANTTSTGGSASHTHSLSGASGSATLNLAVKYASAIIATKD